MKVEIFADEHPFDMEDWINSWLADHPAIIIHDRLQCESAGRLTISIWYTETKEAEGEPASSEG